MKTLRVNNGRPASLGSVTVQPKSSPVSHAKAAKQPTHPSAPGVPPTSEVKLPLHVLSATEDAVSHVMSTSLSEVGAKLMSNGSLVIPLQGSTNTLVPTFHLSMNTGKEFDPRLNQGFVTTTTKFLPYESLTGISQERPEVVMVTSFDPLFNYGSSRTAPKHIDKIEDTGNTQYTTNAGKFFDAQCQIKDLMIYNVQTLIKTLRSRYRNIDQEFTARHDNFANALNKLNVDATFLLNLIRMLETQKYQLDLRHDIYTVNPTQAGSLLMGNFTREQVQAKPAVLKLSGGELAALLSSKNTSSLLSRHKPSYNFVDVLADLGYTESTVRNVFSSSKIWLQLLFELSNTLKYHTLQFIDIDPTYQRNDVNPTTLLNPKVTRFSLATNLPNLPTLEQLKSLQPDGITNAINQIKPAFQKIYQNVSFKNEESRITALAHLISMEYRYSYGLTLSGPVRILNDYYGYTVTTDQRNSAMFDSIIGKFGNNITDFPQQSTNALTSVAQFPAGAFGVLTFESKYVEGDTGTLTPGGDYFFDRVLQTTGKTFNVANLDSLTTTLQNAQSSFSTLVDAFNLMALPASNFPGAEHLSKASVLTSTNDLINAVKNQLINSKGQTTKLLQDDRLASVFAQARKDDGIKAALFLYVLSRSTSGYVTNEPFLNSPGINGTGSPTPLVDALITRINAALKASLPVTRTSKNFLGAGGSDDKVNSPYALNPEGVEAALRKGTPLTALIFQLFNQIILDFSVNSQAITNNFTKYSGCSDTVMMMMVFDLIVSMVDRYGSTSLIGVTGGTTSYLSADTSYIVSRTSTNHRNSVNELRERALGEDTRQQQMVLAISNALNVLAGSVKGIDNYLGSSVATQRLVEISNIMGNNQALTQMLLSEQQIMMFAAQVENLLAANQVQDSTPPWSHASEKANQEVKVLDESQIPQPLKDAVLGYLGTSDFSSKNGIDKKILTIGIPLGFTQQIKQIVNIKTQQRASFQNKRSDIVYVSVYKVDMVNSDIIYKPLRFMFEMSRFPVRFSTDAWRPLPKSPGLPDIINSIPTLNFSDAADDSTSAAINNGVEYASPTVLGHDNPPEAVAMSGGEYSFLTSNQKTQILQNHVVSQLLETYIKVMTGLNVAEYAFNMPVPVASPFAVASPVQPMLDTQFLQTFTNSAVQHLSDTVASKAASSILPAGGVMFATTAVDPPTPTLRGSSPLALKLPQLSNASGVAGVVSDSSQSRAIQTSSPAVKTLAESTVINNISQNLQRFNPGHVPLVWEAFRTISSFSNLLSDVSSVDALNQKVVRPKQFDRIFNVVIDPTIFLVDVEKTTSTPYGKTAMMHMIQNGEIVPATENDVAAASATFSGNKAVTKGSRPFAQGRSASNVNAYKYRNRNTSEGDLIADKYFVTIETFGE